MNPPSQFRPAPLKLGPRLTIWPPVILAPMAGVTNYPFRAICRRFGAGLCISEMVSARGLLENHDRTWQMAHFADDERPRSLQIFGKDPLVMAEAVRRLKGEIDVDHIDLNFGCPVPKVVSKGMGAAALCDLPGCRRIAEAVVETARPIPVTIKVRLGLDETHLTYLEAGHIAEESGCAAIILHGRTARQKYGGKARWEPIQELKEALSIPVLGNGDIFHAEDAMKRLEQSRVDAVVIGRGSLGNPWLFREILARCEGRPLPPQPSAQETVDLVREHYELLRAHFADWPHSAILKMRKLGCAYASGFTGAVEIRRQFQTIDSEEDFNRLLASWPSDGEARVAPPPDVSRLEEDFL